MASTSPQLEHISTFSALRNYDFRLYFFGQLVSVTGTWMQGIAQGFLVYQLTQSEAWLGIVACAAGLAVILLAPFSGVIVDRFPRRPLLMTTQTVQMLLAFVLFALTITQTVQVWHIVVLAFILGATNAIDFPARQTFLLEIVGRDQLKSSIALSVIINNVTRIVGPTLAGVALVSIGVAWCFLLNGLSYVAVLFTMGIMHVPNRIPRKDTQSNALAELKDGLVYARDNREVTRLLVLALIISTFIIPLVQMLPAFASDILFSPDKGYAALSVAQGVGAVIGALVITQLSNRFGYWRVLTIFAVMSGVMMGVFAFQTQLLLAVPLLGVMWFFVLTGYICINTLLQSIVPNEYRGRVLALYTITFTGITPFATLIMGLIANVIGLPTAIALYALITVLCVVGVLRYFRK
jgi:MFS family permease